MRKVGLALLLTALASAFVLGVTAGPASAFRGNPYSEAPINDPAFDASLKTLLGDPALGAGADATTQTGLARMQMAAGRLVSLETLGTAGAILAGSYTVYKIADAAGLGGFVYKKITGSDLSSPPSTGTVRWVYEASGFSNADFGPNSCPWISSGTCGSNPVWISDIGAGAHEYCGTGSTGCRSDMVANSPTMAAAAGTQYSSTVAPGSSSCAASPLGSCKIKIRTSAQMGAAVSIVPATAADYAAAPAGQKVTVGTDSTAAISTTAATAAKHVVGADDGVDRTTSDPPAEKAIDYINNALDPTYDPGKFHMPDCVGLSVSACGAALDAVGATGTRTYTDLGLAGAVVTRPAGAVVTQATAATTYLTKTSPLTFTRNPDAMPILLPQPGINETYDAYVARLVALGWLGTATYIDLTDEQAVVQLGPLTVARITTTTTIGTKTYSPLAWPLLAPRISPTQTVQIYKNPVGLPLATGTLPAPGSSSSGAGGGDGGTGSPGSGSCSCPPLDLTPITGVSVGSKFPFGLFTWIGHAIGLFDVTAITPGLNFPVNPGTTSVHSFGVQHFIFDLGAFDEYMGWMRDLETFFLWVVAVWFVASRFLKVDWGGDPESGSDGLLE